MSGRGHTRIEAIISMKSCSDMSAFLESRFAASARAGTRNVNGLRSITGYAVTDVYVHNGLPTIYLTYDHFVDNGDGQRAHRDFEGFLSVSCPGCRNVKHCGPTSTVRGRHFPSCREQFENCATHFIIEFHRSTFTPQPTTRPFRYGAKHNDIVLGNTMLFGSTVAAVGCAS